MIGSDNRDRKQSQLLQKVAQIVNSTLEIKEVVESVLDQLREIIEYDSSSIQKIEGDRRTLLGARGISYQESSPRLLRPISEDPLVARIVDSKRPLVLSEVSKEKSWEPLPETERINSWIGVPLVAKGEVIGLLTLDHPQIGYYTQESAEIAASFAGQVATAILNANLFQKVRDQALALAELNQLAYRLASVEKPSDPRELLEKIAESAKVVLKADLIELYEYRQDLNKFELPRISVGETRDQTVRKVEIYTDDAVFDVIKRAEPLYEKNAQDQESVFMAPYTVSREDQPKHRFVVREEIQSTAAIPLRTENESMGLMFANYRTTHPFTKEWQELIELFARQAAIAIKNTRLYNSLRRSVRELTTLQEVGRAIPSVLDLYEVLKIILRSIYKTLGFEFATISLVDELRRVIETKQIIWQGEFDIFPEWLKMTIHPLDHWDIQPDIVRTGTTEIIDKWDDRFDKEIWDKFQHDKLIRIFMPIKIEDKVIGTIEAGFHKDTKEEITPDKVRSLEAFVDQAAIAIQNAWLFQRAQDQNNALAKLAEVATELVSIQALKQNPRKLLEQLAKGALEVLKADLVELYEYRQDQNKFLLPRISIGKMRDRTVQKVEIYTDDAIFDIIKRAEPLYEKNAQGPEAVFMAPYTVPREDQPKYRFVVREEIQSTAAIPLRADNENMGLMFANYRTSQAFTTEQRELIELFAKQAAIVIKNVRLYQQIAYINNRLKSLVKIGQTLTADIRLRVGKILDLIYEHANQLLSFNNMSVAFYDKTTDTIKFALATLHNRRVDVEKESGWGIRHAAIGKTGEVIRSKKPLLLPTQEIVKEAGYSPVPGQKDYEGPPANSWLGVPMIVGDKILGVISIEYFGEDYFYTKDDVDIIQALANQAAIAIDNARLYYDVNRRQEALVEFGSRLSSKIHLGEAKILEFIQEQAKQFMDTNNMYIALYDDTTDTVRFGLVFVNGDRIDVNKDKGYQPRKAGKGKTEEIIRTKRPIFHATKKDADAWYLEPGRQEYVSALPSWIGVPMKVEEKVIGVVATYHPRKEYVYNEDDLKILQSMADLAAIALENARLYEEAKRLRDEKIAAEQVATLGTAIAALEHRINNTFSIIFPNLIRLRSRVNLADEIIAETLDIIERNARSTSALIERIQEPLREIESQNVDINAVLDEVVEEEKKQWQLVSIQVNMKLDDSMPHIRAPIGQITEIYRNLINNAYRAMQEKGGWLNITSFLTEGKICVQVQDTGSGIPPDVQHRIFVKPVPSKDKDPGKGAGMGLWLSQLMLKSIGGKIKIEKSDSSGTTMLVQISLPGAVEEE